MHRPSHTLVFGFCSLAACIGLIAFAGWSVSSAEPVSKQRLKPVEAFDGIGNPTERALALFAEAGKVIQHPRCVNCHPAGDRPAQGEISHPHQPLVVRGEDGMGAIAMRCTSCHGQANFDFGRVPGHPQWHLAPIEMAWLGKSLGEICEQIKDPARNGGKSMDELVHHMAEDSLVGWGWEPGVGREPAPGTQKEFGELIKAWVEAGAACPKA
ncbi:Isoquinoline 1-oxidoreductase subunit [Hyphomicrobium sp. CS1GBMeth3]|uniref:Isoquinoline 1-oxidoreductase subunit n=1 Tax=Hyphomicrobium sp. CS1GBMeth3 TaxID=1892845 RepID=UPI0009306F9E|nr:Isoquinoline 1-oxidoreductase subunit [Hyphomicrobium sp. CS1GBMeth3]